MSAVNGHASLGDWDPGSPPPIDFGYQDEPAHASARHAAVNNTRLFWPGDADNYAPPAQLVANLLPAQGTVLIYGPPNSGKTAFTFDLGAAIARGTSWRGRPVADGGGLVVYVAAENPGSAKLRLKGYCTDQPDSTEMPLGIYARPFSLGVAESLDDLVSVIRDAEASTGRRCVAVIIDTLAAAMAGLDENSTADMGVAVASLTRIRDAIGGLVIVVHHSGKDLAQGARGSSALRAAVDTEIAIAGLVGTRTATVVKQRDLPSGATFAFDLVPVGVGFDPITRDTITAVVVRHAAESTQDAQGAHRPTGKAQVAILNAMEAGDPDHVWDDDEIRVACAAAGINSKAARNTRRSALIALATAGFILRTTDGYRLSGTP